MNRILIFILIIIVVFVTLSISTIFSERNPDPRSGDTTPQGVEVLSTGEEGFIDIHYFWSPSCQYCREQNRFWESFIEDYPEVVVYKYSVEDQSVIPKLQEFTDQYDAYQYGGTVPITFVGDSYFPGFYGPDDTGREIEQTVVELIEEEE